MPTLEQARKWYRSDDPIHGFDHVLRVLVLAEQIGRKEGADLEILQAAVLLHDACRDAAEGVAEEGHQETSAKFAKEVLTRDQWPDEKIEQVLHCIRTHRFRTSAAPPQTREAKVLFDADKLDAIGAVGAARAVAFAALAHQPIYSSPSVTFREEGRLEAGEPHSAYHEYLYKLRQIPERLQTASGRRLAKKRLRFLDQFFQRLANESEGRQ
ncbi:MAG: HD domain-containing protein [Anaerolineales bacterium]